MVAPVFGETAVLGAAYKLMKPLFAQLDGVVVVAELAVHEDDQDQLSADAPLGHGADPHVAGVAQENVPDLPGVEYI
eukprot:4240700-Pyramimonas_sp.AAC.1